MERLKIWVLVGCCVLLSGCAAVVFGIGAATGVAGYKYYEGSLHVVYEAPFIDTWDATLKALEAMQMRIESKKHDLTSAVIESRRADGKQVKVSLKYQTAKKTEAVIRVGVFGDEPASVAIKDRIRKELFGQ
jgi:hypothetical protein